MHRIVSDIYAKEGLRGFLKGMMSPLVSRTPVAASLFFAQGYSYRRLTEQHPNMSSTTKHFYSGMVGGFVCLNISFPFDFLKILMQSKIGQDVTYWGEVR